MNPLIADNRLILEKAKLFLKQRVLNLNRKRRIEFAKGFCYELVKSYWNTIAIQRKSKWKVAHYKLSSPNSDTKLTLLALDLAAELNSLSPLEAGDFIGSLYATLLPDEVRAEFGIFYTPPAVVERLINLVSSSNFDWTNSRILDPACGGAAFLAPIASKIVKSFNDIGVDDSYFILNHIIKNLKGIEIDEFAAWISKVLLEISLIDLCLECNLRLPNLIYVADSLTTKEPFVDKYDLVVGNPPYGKIKLTQDLRVQYSESLYGHANLYGVFTHLATKIVKQGGVIAFITPTSFLGGQYFKSLRKLLAEKTPPTSIDFIHERVGVFDSVLQETCLALFKAQKAHNTPVTINSLSIGVKGGDPTIETVGKFELPTNKDEPWLFPRTTLQNNIVGKVSKLSFRLKDYGFIVNTGQLVWNRHKMQLKSKKGKQSLPIVWAESILPNGIFDYKCTRKNHSPFIEIEKAQHFLVTKTECIIVQRTTAKEQKRRVMASILPNSFFKGYPNGVVIENHINIVKPTSNSLVTLDVLLALLNSDAVDQIFRCISGSVAVSAYELNAIPLPNPKEIIELENLIKNNQPSLVNSFITKIYGEQ
jgi:adenine-specific DNA-methyltransferase